MKLKLVLKYKWFDMIDLNVKKHEYRSIKPTIVRLLFNIPSHYTNEAFTECLLENPKDPFLWQYLKPFESVEFYRGYSKNRRITHTEFLGIEIGKAEPEWSDNWQGDVFIIKLGEIIK